jgi:rubrerythrin
MIFPFNAGEVFKIALELEDNGSRFYEEAASRPFPDKVKELFHHLAREEMSHKAVFAEFLAQAPPSATGATVWDPDNELDQYLKMMADQHVFNKGRQELNRMIAGLTDCGQVLTLAMGFEKDSIVFFLELMDAASDDESRGQMKKLVDEERGHLRKLAGLLAAL